MTCSSPDAIVDEARRPQSAGQHFGALGSLPSYAEEPDIPDGATCAEWRWRRQRFMNAVCSTCAVAAFAPVQGDAVVRSIGRRTACC